jgi:hypothetical protein
VARAVPGLVLALAVAACGGSGPVADGGGIPGLVFLGDPLAPRGAPIFVDGDAGDDATGDGSVDHPYRTIARALAEAGGMAPPVEVYVTEKAGGAPYVERPGAAGRPRPLTVPTGVSLFGGYAPDWTRTPGDQTRIDGNPIALSFQPVDMDAALVGFEVVAAAGNASTAVSATAGGTGVLAIHDSGLFGGDATVGSSSALHAAGLAGLRLTDCIVAGGNGADALDGADITAPGDAGADGTWGGDVDNPVPADQDWSLGGAGGALAGLPAHHRGGRGGDGGRSGNEPGEDGRDGGGGAGPAGDGGAGGWLDTAPLIDEAHAAQAGGDGQGGAAGSRGAGGDGHGDVGGLLNAWLRADGADGAAGQPGYGGGGGGGARSLAPLGGVLGSVEGTGGGGGGSGGAGGSGGSGGGGGGASIGVLLVNVAQALLEGDNIRSGGGGDGGDGGTGAPGGPGGAGGGSAIRQGSLQGGAGGAGGIGGRGGGGGGGGGGPSFAVLLAPGDTPVIRDNEFFTGPAGDGGASGGTGPATDAAHGEGGYSVGVYALDPADPPSLSGNTFVIGAPGTSPAAARGGMAAATNI